MPSGVAYALEARRALEELAPGWFTLNAVRRIDEYTTRLRRILQRIAPRPWEAAIVVLTPGPYNAAYYEHRLLADQMGATLVEGYELIVSEDEVYRRAADGGMHRVDVIYSRVNSEWIDPLVFRSESMLGAPGIIEAWRRGNVAIANAPGTGVADDKAIYPYVPAMIRYYLGEEPLIDNVPTFDLSDRVQRDHVIANLDRMVLKPVDASGGYDIHFGRLATAHDRSEIVRRIEAMPRHWLAQEEVSLSKALCLRADGELEPRAVDLRPFVLLDERPWISPGGLTRVAADSQKLVVNSSQGGGSKDTWVLSSLTYAVSHRTTLRYTESVAISFNEVRMRPRDRGSQRTLSFSLLSNPAAAPRSRVDYFGNYVHRVDVTTPHDALEFAMEAVVENSEPRRRRMPTLGP